MTRRPAAYGMLDGDANAMNHVTAADLFTSLAFLACWIADSDFYGRRHRKKTAMPRRYLATALLSHTRALTQTGSNEYGIRCYLAGPRLQAAKIHLVMWRSSLRI
jgi:hypothetical protein